eukprot:3254900-Amphidinium_carterae.1
MGAPMGCEGVPRAGRASSGAAVAASTAIPTAVAVVDTRSGGGRGEAVGNDGLRGCGRGW